MNLKAQTDIIAFIVAIIAILILAPVMLKVVNTSLSSFSTAINQTSNVASERVTSVHNTFVSFWDWLIAIAFLVNVLMLFVFAFLVDTHPIFSLFYLISSVITISFSHYIITPISTILGMDAFSQEVLQLPITGFIVNWFDLILLGIIIVTGVIMYGKYSGGGVSR